MRQTIRMGDEGASVFEAQTLLLKHGEFTNALEADGKFGNRTKTAVVNFQRKNGLAEDGVVGAKTWAKLDDTESNEKRVVYLDQVEKEKRFGSFEYFPERAKTKNGDPITIIDGWAEENIISVEIPQLKGVPLYDKNSKEKCSGKVRLHKKCASQFVQFFKDIEEAGLLHFVKTYDGAFNPRFVRGSDKSLSNHSWGTAIDINAYANGLNKEPAPIGTDGTVIPLVPYMKKNGLYWGGYFTRKDSMHVECGKVI